MTADLKALCRCCLEKLDDGQVEITENVKVWFHELVQAQVSQKNREWLEITFYFFLARRFSTIAQQNLPKMRVESFHIFVT